MPTPPPLPDAALAQPPTEPGTKRPGKVEREPTARDFTPGAVNRAVLSEALQHPLTILPAAASAVGGLYLGLFGLDPQAFAVTFASALVAAGAWVVNYFIRGEALAERHVRKLRARRQALRDEQLASLEAEWSRTGHADGYQQARELRLAYDKLAGFLRERIETSGSLSAERLLVLAEDSYREGAAILRQALDSYRALAAMDAVKLRSELARWQRQLEGLGDDPAAASRAAALKTRIDSNERRLELYEDKVESVHRLLAESEALEAALESAYLEAIDRQRPDLLTRGHAAEELERAMTAARRVEERLRGLGRAASKEQDDVYLAAGERPRS